MHLFFAAGVIFKWFWLIGRRYLKTMILSRMAHKEAQYKCQFQL